VIRNHWCRSAALGVALLALGVACTPAAPSASSPASGPASGSAAPSSAGQAAPGAPTKVKMGQTGPSPASWALFIALARGIYLQEGLELENVILDSSATQTQALIAGDLNFNTYSVDSVAKAVVAGAPLKMIGSAQVIPNFQLIVANDITSFQDLKGKSLAAGSPGGYFDIVLRGMLTARGLSDGDYQVLSIGNARARTPAIKAGQVSGAILGGPDDSVALAEGLKSLGYVHQVIPDLQYSGYAVSDEWAKTHRAVVLAFLRSTLRSLDWLFDPANKDEAKAIYAQVAELPPEFLESIYDQMVNQRMLSRDARPNLKGTENVLTMAVNQGNLLSLPPLETWFDLSYLDEAAQQVQQRRG
jgi:NitT/TauT family transport system substrate-binding protein